MLFRPTVRVWGWRLALLMLPLLALPGTARTAGTPAGTVIRNAAMATFKDEQGHAMPPALSNEVVSIVAQVAGVDVSPATAAKEVTPGGSAVFAILVTNVGNGTDTFDLSVTGLPAGWTGVLYRDLNQDGILDANEQGADNRPAFVSLAADATAHVLLVVTALGDAVDRQAAAATVTATSQFNNTIDDTGISTATVSVGVVTILKTAVSATPRPEEVVTYAIQVENTGSATASRAVIIDALPLGVTYVPGSLRFGVGSTLTYENAQALTDANDEDAGDFGLTASNTATVRWGDIASGQTGVVFFRVTVNDGVRAGTIIDNVATITFDRPGGIPAPPVTSPPARLTVQPPPYTDGQISQPPYVVPGEALTITVRDADLAVDGIAEVLVTVINTRTGETEEVLLPETGPQSGEYAGVIATRLDADPGQSGDDRLNVQADDHLQGHYADERTVSGTPQDRTAETVVLPTQIALTPDPQTIVGNGADQSLLAARVTDSLGRPLPDGTLVVFTADKGTFANGTGQITVPVSGGNGEAVAIFTAPILSASGVAQVVASFGGYDSETINLEVLPGALGIRVWDQIRGVEVKADDPDLIVEVTLFGTTVTGEFISYTVRLDKNGLFVVPDIPPGNYQLKVRVTRISTGQMVYDGAQQQIRVNFDGSTTPPTNSITGTVRSRAEKNGTRWAGSRVNLVNEQGVVVATAILDADGRYDFQNLPPGNYTLQFELPDGETLTLPIASRSRLVGAVVVNADILIDPFGQAFDGRAGTVIPNVTVTLRTLSDEVLPIPPLNGIGARPNVNNVNPFVTNESGRYAFLFGGSQVGAFGSPVTHILSVTPPPGSSYLPRRMYLTVQPAAPGPITAQSVITIRAHSADGLELALPNSFDLTSGEVYVPDIAVIAFNIPMFTVAPVIRFTKTAVQDTVSPGQPVEFRLALANTGNEAAHGVTVVDTLGGDWQVLSAPGAQVLNQDIVQWAVGDLLPGQQDTLRIQAKITSAPPDGATLVNTAWLRTDRGLAVEADAAVTVRPSAVAVAIDLTPDPRMIVGNGVDQSILTARVTDSLGRPLPDGSLVVFRTTQGTFANGTQQITVLISGGNGEAVAVFTAPVLSANDTARVVASYGGHDSGAVDIEVLPGAVGIRVWDQLRGVEVKASDPSLRVEVTLFGTTVAGQPISYTVTLDERGLFIVPDIPPGTYQLKASVIDITTGRLIYDGALQDIRVNFDGSVTPPSNSITGRMHGRSEASGARFAGLTVELLDAQGVVVATSILDAEGWYDFQSLRPGLYTVRVRLPDGDTILTRIASRSRSVGAVVVNADILIDPFGQTFDPNIGIAVPGITVSIQTLSDQPLPIPALGGTGAVPNTNNANPFVTTANGRYAFLFGGDQVGSFGSPATYVLTATPPAGSPYLPRRISLSVQPAAPGPITAQSVITIRAHSADGLELALPNSFALTTGSVEVPDIAVVALNIPMFTIAPVLRLTKTAAPDEVTPGQTAEFHVAIANVGNEAARGVTIADTLTSDWRLLSISRGSILAPNVVGWTVGDLLPGQQDTLSLRAELIPPQPNGVTLSNTAWVRTSRGVSSDARAGVIVRSAPTWELRIRAEADSVGPGQQVPYTITFTNIGTQTAVGFTLIDSLPPVLIPVSVTNGQAGPATKPVGVAYLSGGRIDGQRIVWPLPDMAIGQTDSTHFIAQVVDSIQVGTTILDKALIHGPDSRTWAATAMTTPVRRPQLSLTKRAVPDTVHTGDTVVFHLIVRNDDAITVPGPIALVDSLPPGITLVSARGKPVVSGNVLTWTYASLAPGTVDTVSLTVRVQTTNPWVENIAWLINYDRRLSASAKVLIKPTQMVVLTKTANQSMIEAGETVDYTITVNAPADTLTAVTVSDTLPNAFAYVAGSSQPPAVYDSLAHALVWTLPVITPQQMQTLRASLTPRPGLEPGEHPTRNVAVASWNGLTYASNPADVVVTVPFFTVQKSADQSVAETGEFVVYRVVLQNLSTSTDLTNVIVRDRLPYGFDYVKGTARLDGQLLAPDSLRGRDVVWRVARLDAGKTRRLSYRLVLGADAESGDGMNVVMASATTARGYPAPAGPARAKVRVRPDLFSRGEVIVGKAWVDLNENGIQEKGEPPVPGVVMIMEDGTRIIADRQGRFSIPEVRAGSHVLRLLDRNIPSDLEPMVLGTRSAQDPWIRFADVSQTGLAKANFPFRHKSAPPALPAPPASPSSRIQKTASVVPPRARFWVERTVRLETTGSAQGGGGDPLFSVVFRTQALGTPQGQRLAISQDLPAGYQFIPAQTGQTGELTPGDSLVYHLASNLSALPDLAMPVIRIADFGVRIADKTSLTLPLRSVGRDATTDRLRDLWTTELPVSETRIASTDSSAIRNPQSAMPLSVYAGATVRYRLAVVAPNGGQIVDVLPPGVTLRAVDSQGQAVGDTVRWTLAASTAPETLWTTVQVSPNVRGNLKNRAILWTPAPDTSMTRDARVGKGLTTDHRPLTTDSLVPSSRDSATVTILPRPAWAVSASTSPETLFVEVKHERLSSLGADSFESGLADLRENAIVTLRALRAKLETIPDKPIIVSGHTDSNPIHTPQFPSNDELSLARAEAIKTWLVAAGIDPKRIITQGHGPRRPVATNSTPEGRRRNRRVEIEITETDVERIPFEVGLTRTTTVTYRGTEPVARMQLADSLGVGMVFRAGSASVPPFVGNGVLVWSLQHVKPGETFTVSYQVDVTGTTSGSTALPIRSVVSYSLPDGQWITNPAVTGKPSVVVPTQQTQSGSMGGSP